MNTTADFNPAARTSIVIPNRGTLEASEKVIAFADEDCVPSATWPAPLASCLANDPALRGPVEGSLGGMGRRETGPEGAGLTGIIATPPMDITDGLNPAQKMAVEAINGPLLIVAGPGSGKTRVITHRIAYLVKVCGVRPYRIMAVTFTNKAAKEMKERLRRLLGDEAGDLAMGTFHSLCARILRIEAERAGLEKGFAIYDADDSASLIRRSMKDVEVDPKKFGPGALANAISRAKAHLLLPVEFALQKSNYFDEIVLRVYERYQALLAQCNAVDFDDLLMKTVRLFQGNKAVLEKYQERYLHVMIDEFQDTSKVQYEFARLLAGKYRNLCVVGDPDQSIYSWRFADAGNILDFKTKYAGAKVVLLEQNYRSTQNILDAASGVIAKNPGREATTLWTENQKGVAISLVEALNESDEAVKIINEVERLVRAGAKHGDCAVLYRTNAQSRPIEEGFLRYGMPYHLVGATRFYERREVKDMLAYIRLIGNPFDDVSLLRVINLPARGIGDRTLDELTRWASAHGVPLYTAIQMVAGKGDVRLEQDGPLPEIAPRLVKSLEGFVDLIDRITEVGREGTLPGLFDIVLNQTGYKDYILAGDDRGEERLDNVKEMSSVAVEFAHMEMGEALTAFLEQVALVSDTDNLDQRANSVTLITLHQAKGLEFPYVFMVGMEENVLPHQRSMQDETQMEEERRLTYVGITRAQKGLYLLRAFRRVAMGKMNENKASRFLDDLPERVLASTRAPRPRTDQWGSSPWSSSSRERKVPSGPAPFRAGDRVKHGSFGDGVVVSCAPSDDDYQVTVAFRGGAGLKKLLTSLAKLQKVT